MKILIYIKDKINNSLGTKINLVFALLVSLFIIFSFYNNQSLKTSANNYNSTISTYYEVMQLKNYVLNCDTSISEYLRSGNRTTLSDFNNTAASFRKLLYKLSNKSTNIETLYLMRSISDSYESYFSACSTACSKYYSNDHDYYTYMYSAERINKYLQQYCDELLSVSIIDGKNTYERMQRLQNILKNFNLLVILIIISFYFLIVLYVNINITYPLGKLVIAANRVSKGNFDTHVTTKNTTDTIGVLTTAFNTMSQSIKSMMQSIKDNAETEKHLLVEQQKNVEYQHMLSQANFLALQSQTNPHFMFNTLNSISRTITLGMSEQAVMMISSMVNLLRYNLTNANLTVTLYDELAITLEYLKIQQYRFKGRIFSKIDCSEELAKKIILPRFTLQPIVENAIIHGLEPNEVGGTIKIKVREKNDKFIIKIIDNGIGIDIETLRKIQAGKQFASDTNSIGVNNTRKRIEIFTQSDSSFKLMSKKGVGTVVIITI